MVQLNNEPSWVSTRKGSLSPPTKLCIWEKSNTDSSDGAEYTTDKSVKKEGKL